MMAGEITNILFIMYDQLRFDYLSCSGHPHLETPNFDRVAQMGVRFSRTYVQSPVCGSSRMSYYTGRYVSSHGAQGNNHPLKVGEMTLGDHLRPLGMDAWLIGKTHMTVDVAGMNRLGLSTDGVIGARVSECGFDTWVRDDGLWAEGPDGFYDQRRSPYNEYLRQKGYSAENPWHDNANSGVDDSGDIASGFLMKNAARPANVRTEDSETVWLTTRAIDFMEAHKGGAPWLAHVSYIKPHWPYIVPEPYHDMYGEKDVLPVVRSAGEKENPHPVFEAYMTGKIGSSFHRHEVRNAVIPAYMGLIKQCDDELGRLLAYLDESGQMDSTMIVLTSDHGDYLGDHWMGEKDLFHDPSVRVPLIIYDPSAEADETRGSVCDYLVQAIDLVPTFVEAAGGQVPDHILEGQSLMPFLHNADTGERRVFVISEYDYSSSAAAAKLGLAPRDCRLFMVVTERWKFMHAEGGMRPMLFDLQEDPQELNDLGDNPDYSSIINEMYDHLFTWSRRMSQRTTLSEAAIIARRGKAARRGILLGVYDENDIDEQMLTRYRGKALEI